MSGPLEEVESVADAERVRDAWEHPALFEADLVLVDPSLPGRRAISSQGVREASGARVIVCASESGKDAALSALQAGAVGYLRKDELTPETLSSAVRAAADGTSVVDARPARAPAGQAARERASPSRRRRG